MPSHLIFRLQIAPEDVNYISKLMNERYVDVGIGDIKGMREDATKEATAEAEAEATKSKGANNMGYVSYKERQNIANLSGKKFIEAGGRIFAKVEPLELITFKVSRIRR